MCRTGARSTAFNDHDTRSDLLEGTRSSSGNGPSFQAIHDSVEIGEVVREDTQYVAEGTEYPRMQNVIDIVHGRGVRPPDGERLEFMAGCVRSCCDRRRRIAFGKEHWMVGIKACVIDSQSSDTVITPFLDVIWKELSQSLGFGFPTDE